MHDLRSAGRGADREEMDREGGAVRPDSGRVGRLSPGCVTAGGHHHDGDDPARLEPGEEKAPDTPGLHEALPENGAFVAIENLIDDGRRTNAFGLMMSLNMLIEFGDAFDFTGAEFWDWSREAGFRRYEVMHLAGPCSAAIAYK
jgi:hypothetical protein